MNDALQSYTPTERPLEYDSLTAREGCEAITGTDFLGWRSYTQICVFAHDPTSQLFNQKDTVSYSLGPLDFNVATKPWNTIWAVWQATSGLRVGKLGSVTPPADAKGVVATLYPSIQTVKVAHAFNDSGFLAIAVQKTATGIELRRFTDIGGTVAASMFTGRSPVMFNTSLLDSSIETKSGIVVMYLRPERPNVLFGRFERDTTPYGFERILMADLRVAPQRLISVRVEGRQQVLRYIDTDGRDVYLTSPVYTVDASGNSKAKITTSVAGGAAYTLAVPIDSGFDKAKITMAMAGGFVYDATQFPDSPNNPLPFDSCLVTVGLDSGEVFTP